MRFLIKNIEAIKKDVKLSVKDRKLIQLLVQDGRMPVSTLAKKLGISRPAVTQKIKSLQQKNVLLTPLAYTHIGLIGETMYTLQIGTDLGYDTREITSKLLGIPGIFSVLWYNSPFNLTFGLNHGDVQETIQQIELVIPIKKIRISRVLHHWFHPPHLFKDVPNKGISQHNTIPTIKNTDKKILRDLIDNPRVPVSNIAQKHRIAPLTVKRRIKEMVKNGAIIAFTNFVNPWLCRKDIVSIHLIVKGRDNIIKLTSKLLTIPSVGNIWELDHEWNINIILWVENQLEVSQFMNSISKEFDGIIDSDIMVLAGMVGK
jgi:DNA-binding Lrp family transcriptional regulator